MQDGDRFPDALVSFEEFLRIDMRVGRVVRADVFPQARKPALKLLIDFGTEIGVRKSSAQITALYRPEALVGKLVIAVVNFPPRQVGPFMSEVLVLGLHDHEGRVALCCPEFDVPLGSRLQ